MIPVENNRVFGLDILRASAIVMVLVAHTWPSKSHGQWAGALAVLGVELFFVLSGFLIGRILIRLAQERRLHSLADVYAFWRRRWFRTLPNYYLFLALHLVWRTWVLGFPDQIATNWEYFVFMQNFTHPPPFFFPETWSLAVEEWFYLLFPVLLFVALHAFTRPKYAWLVVVALFMVVPTAFRLWTAIEATPPVDAGQLEGARRVWDSIVRKMVLFRLDVVMYGAIAALVSVWRPDLWRRLGSGWVAGFALLLISAGSIGWHTPLDTGNRWHAFALWPVISIGFALLLPAFNSIATGRGAVACGTSWMAKISYSLYLCHGLVLLAIARWLGPKTAAGLAPNTIWWTLTAWAGSLLVAYVVYRWFERPCMNLRERFKKPAVSGALDGKKAVAERIY